jgi:SAM-dependent methyltransferase
MTNRLAVRLTTLLYSDHNASARIDALVHKCLERIGTGRGLAVGEPGRRLHPRMWNLDIVHTPSIDVQADASRLPFADAAFEVVLTQECLEHVEQVGLATREMFRVLKPGGTLYCQLPFVIGFHSGPYDFWRFTEEGIKSLFRDAGFQIEESGISTGPAAGFYHIAVEFFATLGSAIWPRLYVPCKGVAALTLYWIKWLDVLLMRSPDAARIARGHYVIARKPASPIASESHSTHNTG